MYLFYRKRNIPGNNLPSWELINQLNKDRCKDFLGLVDFILSIPVHSADAERGFSALKRTKSDWRSKLKDTHLSDLFLVQLEGPDIKKFDPSDAIFLWSNKDRRPNHKPHKETVELHVTDSDISDSDSVSDSGSDLESDSESDVLSISDSDCVDVN